MSFKYFAYGSNLFSNRMRINCPSAVKKNIGVLKDFKLTFVGYANSWKGSVATIINSPGSNVWGVIWEIDKDHEDNLDRQERVYNPIEVSVQTDQGLLQCKTYQAKLSEEQGLPSTVYKAVIINGAIEHGLPEKYLTYLKSIEDNGYKGKVDIPVSVNI